jgi:ribosomal protein S18 acetylase RimI-like enzyme
MVGVTSIRLARLDEAHAIESLIERSVRILQAPDYTEAQREGALGTVFGVDRQLIKDGSYLVAEQHGKLVGCGGWSRRSAVFGADALTGADNAEMRPGTDPARIRAFFIEPGHERQGIGSTIMCACEEAAFAYGFTELELVSTVTGEILYARHGFSVVERFETRLPNGHSLPVIRMRKTLQKA